MKTLTTHIQEKIKALRHEINAIQYTNKIDGLTAENDTQKITECINKIQVLNEVLISYETQNFKKK